MEVKKSALKEAVKQVYLSNLTGEKVEEEIKLKLKPEGLINDKGELTEKGRSLIKVVLAGGVFDIIHPGHVYFLKKSKELGDVLVVVVARDENVKKFKGVEPMHNESMRLELVSSIKYVDAAILGDKNDLMVTVEKVKPDIVALGYDQVHDEAWIKEEAKKRGIKLEVVRLDSPYPNIKSRNIKRDPRFGTL